MLAKKAIRLPDRFQKLLSFSSSDKIQYRTQPCKQSGSFAENPVQLLYPARQFSHICHSISCKPFLHRYLNKNEHIWQLISLAIAKTRFRCYHMVKEISFNPLLRRLRPSAGFYAKECAAVAKSDLIKKLNINDFGPTKSSKQSSIILVHIVSSAMPNRFADSAARFKTSMIESGLTKNCVRPFSQSFKNLKST